MQHPAHVFAAKRGKIRAGDGELAQRDAVAARRDLPDGVRALHIRLQAASAYEMLGKHKEARALLGQALADAAEDGLVIPFVENYRYLKPLLAEAVHSGLIHRITTLGAAAEDRRSRSSCPALPGLTPREQEIASLAALRLSNREIAEKLHLSEGSVKQYISQIYSKLAITGDTRLKRQRLAELINT